MAKKHQQDKSEGKKGIDIGWVKDIELLEPVTAWKSLSSVREARKKAQFFFEETPYQELIIERGTEKNNAKKKGFRISSSNVLVCKEPTG